jgi:hypothetical protein
MKLPSGTPLYRGLGGTLELPPSFFSQDEHGCSGYMDWGLMSTTANLETAVNYSGAKEDKPLPMVLTPPTPPLLAHDPNILHAARYKSACRCDSQVLMLEVSAIDRGANIMSMSQYPGEVRRPIWLH